MLNIAKKLASHEVKIRDSGVELVNEWLSDNEKPKTYLEMQKLWTALFFCMWHSDKPIVQHELGQTLAKTIHLVSDLNDRNLWIKAFWEIHTEKWRDIDRHRLDKYYALLRYFIRESLTILKNENWDNDSISDFLKVLTEYPLSLDAPRGIIFHLSDLYCEEIQTVFSKPLYTVDPDLFLNLLEPFFNLLKHSEKVVTKRLNTSIFEGLLEQWSDYFSVDKSETEGFNEVSQFLEKISEKLHITALSKDIHSHNRTAFFNIAQTVENVMELMGKTPKKIRLEAKSQQQLNNNVNVQENKANDGEAGEDDSEDSEGDSDEMESDSQTKTKSASQSPQVAKQPKPLLRKKRRSSLSNKQKKSVMFDLNKNTTFQAPKAPRKPILYGTSALGNPIRKTKQKSKKRTMRRYK